MGLPPRPIWRPLNKTPRAPTRACPQVSFATLQGDNLGVQKKKTSSLWVVLDRWWRFSKIFFEFSTRSLGFHDPIWRSYFSDGLVKNHQLMVRNQELKYHPPKKNSKLTILVTFFGSFSCKQRLDKNPGVSLLMESGVNSCVLELGQNYKNCRKSRVAKNEKHL